MGHVLSPSPHRISATARFRPSRSTGRQPPVYDGGGDGRSPNRLFAESLGWRRARSPCCLTHRVAFNSPGIQRFRGPPYIPAQILSGPSRTPVEFRQPYRFAPAGGRSASGSRNCYNAQGVRGAGNWLVSTRTRPPGASKCATRLVPYAGLLQLALTKKSPYVRQTVSLYYNAAFYAGMNSPQPSNRPARAAV